MVVQPDGSVVVAARASNNFGFVRFTPSGAVDTSFDTDGYQTVSFGGTATVGGLALQPDGKIVAVGQFSGDFALARLNADASVDNGFSGDGATPTGRSIRRSTATGS